MEHTSTLGGSAIDCDLLVVGGGINGAGIARDAAGRGLSVVLVEKDDLAAHTSSSSTKLIHGGLRYLEHYEFGLVRKALLEREVLLRSAPHIMWPLRFVMPHDPSMRPVWMIRLGIFLYDHLAKREVLPGSETISLASHAAGRPLKPEFTKGFVYSDGWVDDARLVVLNALHAEDHGARIFTRTRCVSAQRTSDGWTAVLQGRDERMVTVRAKALVNAAGPWAAQFLRDNARQQGTKNLRLIKGSHIIVRKLFDHDMAYIFQNPDKRIVFAIPYERDFTLIGTTDVEHHGDADSAAISANETEYLCTLINRYFKRHITPADVVWSYAGVRPLLDDAEGDPSAVTRDYFLELDRGAAPLLTVWGGKITTFRKLAEEAVDMLLPTMNRKAAAWTARAFLPGGDLSGCIGKATRPDQDFERYVQALLRTQPWLPAALARRFARAYGSRTGELLDGAAALRDLGDEVAPGLYEAEVRFLVHREWAQTADDILWRRSKLGLHYTPMERQRVQHWMTTHDLS